MTLATGRVLQFDAERGYGFIAADDGGEDVFLHSSVFDGDPRELAPGVPVEFEVMAGDRGRKAFAVHRARGGATPADPPRPPAPVSAPVPVPVHQPVDDEGMCEVLSESEFSQEVTELLIEAVPALTGTQIVQTRKSLLEFAKKRGWVDV